MDYIRIFDGGLSRVNFFSLGLGSSRVTPFLLFILCLFILAFYLYRHYLLFFNITFFVCSPALTHYSKKM